jgi:hypothetical protein
VRWQPAVDVNRFVLARTALAALALVTADLIARPRTRS